MNVGGLTNEQHQRLKIAEKSHKYGHLATWKELFIYQMSSATPVQIQEIAAFAKKRARLPLMGGVK